MEQRRARPGGGLAGRPPQSAAHTRSRHLDGQLARLGGGRSRRRADGCGARAAAALLHRGADRPCPARRGRRHRARAPGAGRPMASGALGAVRGGKSGARLCAPALRARPDAAAYGEDHVHLRHHGRAERRVPRRGWHAAGIRRTGGSDGAAGHPAPPVRAAVRRTAREHRRCHGAAVARRHLHRPAAAGAGIDRVVQLRCRSLSGCRCTAPAAQHHPAAANAARLGRSSHDKRAARARLTPDGGRGRRGRRRQAAPRRTRAGDSGLRRLRPVRGRLGPDTQPSRCRPHRHRRTRPAACPLARGGRRRDRDCGQPVRRLSREHRTDATVVAHRRPRHDRRRWLRPRPGAKEAGAHHRIRPQRFAGMGRNCPA